MSPRIDVPRFVLFVVCFLTLCTGCMLDPEPAASSGGETQPPAPQPPAPQPPADDDPESSEIQVILPPDGATVTAPMQLSAYGPAIDSVDFEVEGTVILQDTVAPFAWTLSPDSFSQGEYEIAVSVRHAGGLDRQSVRVTLSSAPSGPVQPQEVFEAVKNLQGGHWYEIPNTKLEAVKPNPVPFPGSIQWLITAWNSGAFDTKRDRLVIWGGGHADYAGNELYVFDLNTLQWSRLTDPSPFSPSDPENRLDSEVHPDGRPVSRHTYNYLTYIPPPVDRFFSGGGASLYRQSFQSDITWLFDFDRLEWERKSACPVAYIGAMCAVAPDGRVWQHGAGMLSRLAVYDATTDTWTRHGDSAGWLDYDYTAEIDPVRNRLLGIGGGDVLAWDLNNPNQPHTRLQTSGDQSVQNVRNPGVAYHAGTGKFVAWNGGASVFTLDLEALRWTRIDTSGSVSPGPAVPGGTYGRFRYSPKQNLFVVVNGTDRNVAVYRLPE